MPTYAAFLGSQPHVSITELGSVLPDMKLHRMYGGVIALLETDLPLTQPFLDRLGGTVLIAQEINRQAALEDAPRLLTEAAQGIKGKVTFSFRAYGVPRDLVARMYRDAKKILKSRNIPARYIGNEKKPPVTGQLHDEGIIGGKHGVEIVLLGDEDRVWIGRTVAAQDPAAYAFRDMQKPVRDTRAGLLPPKLAQILLNLGAWACGAAAPNEKLKMQNATFTIFDPFCGTGVIPMEALLRGWPVFASDISQRAVTGCEKNLDWIRKEKKILKRDVPSEIWKQDATKEFSFKQLPDVIVTETALGPALDMRATARDAAKFRSQMDDLEIAFLKNAAATLPGVPIVATFPMWEVRSGAIHLERVWKEIPNIGYKLVLPPHAEPSDRSRFSVLYKRPDQFVGREIVVLRPRK